MVLPRPKRCTAPTSHIRWSDAVIHVVPGTGLEPVRPRGAARFKLAVSAFHHPGRPWAPSDGSEPIRTHPPNSGTAARCCLILLTSEGASGHDMGHPHLPKALRPRSTAAYGMTEFHRPHTPRTRGGHKRLPSSPLRGAPSSPGMTPAPGVRLESSPRTRTAADYTRPARRHDGGTTNTERRPDGSISL